MTAQGFAVSLHKTALANGSKRLFVLYGLGLFETAHLLHPHEDSSRADDDKLPFIPVSTLDLVSEPI